MSASIWDEIHQAIIAANDAAHQEARDGYQPRERNDPRSVRVFAFHKLLDRALGPGIKAGFHGETVKGWLDALRQPFFRLVWWDAEPLTTGRQPIKGKRPIKINPLHRIAERLGAVQEAEQPVWELAAASAGPEAAIADAGQGGGGKKNSRLNTIIYYGERRYGIGEEEPIYLSDNEDSVLAAFLPMSAMDKPTLIEKSGVFHAPVILTRLRTKFGGRFAPAIRTPGGKAKGGYSVRIRAASKAVTHRNPKHT